MRIILRATAHKGHNNMYTDLTVLQFGIQKIQNLTVSTTMRKVRTTKVKKKTPCPAVYVTLYYQ